LLSHFFPEPKTLIPETISGDFVDGVVEEEDEGFEGSVGDEKVAMKSADYVV